MANDAATPNYRDLAQRLLSSVARPERYTFQRQLQSVAIDLMFGADPALLISRLVELGAPPADARRIIETADKDPLIANGRAMALTLRKRDWLLDALEQQQRLWPAAGKIERISSVGSEEFLERYYSRNRPVILAGEMRDWPALRKWTPRYMAMTIGAFEIEYRANDDRPRSADQRDEVVRRMPFDDFIRMISEPGGGRGGYMLANDQALNVAIAGWLKSDLGFLGSLLDLEAPDAGGTLWIGSSGILTPLHHDLANCLIAQIVGKNRFMIVAAGEVAKLYNNRGALSQIRDLEADWDRTQFPALADAKIYDVTLEPGEALFLPLAWWYQVRSVGFGASVTFTNFRWPNDSYRSYPLR